MTDSSARVAIVTGASRGIGAAAATEFGRYGYRVVVNYHSNADAAKSVVEQVETAGGQGLAVSGDVRQEDEAGNLAEAALDAYGRIDTLVCNAPSGSFKPAAFEHMAWGDFAAKVEGELSAAFHISQSVLPTMQQQQYGRLVYVSSSHAAGPAAPGMIAHGSAKAALDTFMRYVAHEQGPHGITANVVSPGYVRTDATSGSVPPQYENEISRRTAIRRVGEPIDIGRVIALVGREESAFTSGAVIPATGGMSLGFMDGFH